MPALLVEDRPHDALQVRVAGDVHRQGVAAGGADRVQALDAAGAAVDGVAGAQQLQGGGAPDPRRGPGDEHDLRHGRPCWHASGPRCHSWRAHRARLSPPKGRTRREAWSALLELLDPGGPGGDRRHPRRDGADRRARRGSRASRVMDHYFQMEHAGSADEPMLEGYTTLGYVAARTERMTLGLLVTGVMYRHPGLLAKIVTTLDVLSGGRARLGIGASWYEREQRRPRRAGGAGGGAVRAAGGDAADLPADVERRQRAVQRAPLPARRDAVRARSRSAGRTRRS